MRHTRRQLAPLFVTLVLGGHLAGGCVLDWDGARPTDKTRDLGRDTEGAAESGAPDAAADVGRFDLYLQPDGRIDAAQADSLAVDLQPTDLLPTPDSKPLPTCPYSTLYSPTTGGLETALNAAIGKGHKLVSLHYSGKFRGAWVMQKNGQYKGTVDQYGKIVATWITQQVKAGAQLVSLHGTADKVAAWTENNGTYTFHERATYAALESDVGAEVAKGSKVVAFAGRRLLSFFEWAVWLTDGSTYKVASDTVLVNVINTLNSPASSGYKPVDYHTNTYVRFVWYKDAKGSYSYLSDSSGLGLANKLNPELAAGATIEAFNGIDSSTDIAWTIKGNQVTFLNHKLGEQLAKLINVEVAKGAKLHTYRSGYAGTTALLTKPCP